MFEKKMMRGLPHRTVSKELEAHQKEMSEIRMERLFSEDSNRFFRFSLRVGEIFLDYSKNRISEKTMDLLFELAREAKVEGLRDRMFIGEKINNTENRAVLHAALRNRSGEAIRVDGEDVMPKVEAAIRKMGDFAERVRSGEWVGRSGKRIRNVVNIGIGGSDLGPKMVYEALSAYRSPDLEVRFMSNIDGPHVLETLDGLDPETTLFIVASKTFTTPETMMNAHFAREWFLSKGADESQIAKHFVAVSTNEAGVAGFGIDTENMFEFWDWVGGRYSLWSSIGLPIVIAVGPERFIELLDGAFAMDEHFKTAPLEKNMPMILALLGVWYGNFWDAQTVAILPYDHRLRSLPAYLQQADMESNGKSVSRSGAEVDCATGPIVWGATGINGQHAFYQLLHQGTRLIPADFIVSLARSTDLPEHHDMLLANFMAQTEALMMGRSKEKTREVASEFVEQKTFPGNRPSNAILLDSLTPHALGMLIALYEHKIFAQGAIWDINSFDQWGVELGKKLASRLLSEIRGEQVDGGHDQSTRELLKMCKEATKLDRKS